VLANIYAAFAETAAKLWAYARCLGPGRRPGTGMLIGMLPLPYSILPYFALLSIYLRAHFSTLIHPLGVSREREREKESI
jgi:hypothetical protein